MSDQQQPSLSQPETGLPEVQHPEMEHLEAGHPPMGRSEMGRSGMEQPETEPPAMGPPRMEQPETEPPDKTPFWGYNDLLLFIGLAPVCLILGYTLVKLPLRILHIHPAVQVEEAIPEQLMGYLFLFGALGLIFRQGYGRPFWESLGWTKMRLPLGVVVCFGVLTGVIVVIASALIRLPDKANPMTEMMDTRTAILLMTLFGVTVAPLCEELAFRGFLQPLLARSLGAAPAILLAAIPFGLLHYPEYGDSWRHALIISAAGAAFGAMRQFSGSTKAAVLMHASYNAFFFLVMFADGKDLPHSW
jgi:membrane protease YdiL (CAAX protease family)